MGQYHYIINLSKREYLNPHKLGDGLKLWEQLNSHGGVMAALHILLACSNGRGGGDLYTVEVKEGVEYYNPADPNWVGRWAGDRIAVVGDYAERGDLALEHEADLICDLCGTEEQRQTAITHYRKLAKERGGEYKAIFTDKAERLANARLYQDISDDILPLVEQACDVRITGEGWRDKTLTTQKGTVAMRSDMVLTVKPKGKGKEWLKQVKQRIEKETGKQVEVTGGPYRGYDVQVDLSAEIPKVDFYSPIRMDSREADAIDYAICCIKEGRILTPEEHDRR
jgi:hypothetical protein